MKKSLFGPWSSLLDVMFNDAESVSICEIGTHRAKTAEQICLHLLQNHKCKLHYIGYDAFELATPDSDNDEINGKGPGDYMYANHMLRRINNKNFKFKLIKGWTQDTLKPGKYDLVYIDGGHSYETVKHDHEKLEMSNIVVFDDYQIPDVKRYVDEYIYKNSIVQVDWNLDTIKNLNETVYSFMPHKVKKQKQFVLGQPTGHIQPVIFRK